MRREKIGENICPILEARRNKGTICANSGFEEGGIGSQDADSRKRISMRGRKRRERKRKRVAGKEEICGKKGTVKKESNKSEGIVLGGMARGFPLCLVKGFLEERGKKGAEKGGERSGVGDFAGASLLREEKFLIKREKTWKTGAAKKRERGTLTMGDI